MVTLAAVQPRIRTSARSSRSLGDEAADWAADHGLVLDEWQREFLVDGCRVRSDGRWSSFESGLNVPRQNGKGVVLMVRELAGLYLWGEELVIHSAHEFATSQEHFRRCEDFIRDNDDLLVKVKFGRGNYTGFAHSHGDERIELVDGSRILFRTRTKSGARGFTGDLNVFDEAMIISDAAHSAMLPIVRAKSKGSKRGVQVWYAGSAVDQEIHQHGLVWTRIRERAIKGEDPELVYHEFSVAAEHPDEVSDSMASDEEQWRLANPALDVRIDVEHMHREKRAFDSNHRGFCVELLGVGDYPATDGAAASVIPLDDWLALVDDRSYIAGSFSLAFDVSPNRRTSICRVGAGPDGRLVLELVENRAGTGWLPELLAEKAAEHDVVEIVCDGFGPSGSVVAAVEEFGVKVRQLNSTEVGQACGRLQDAVAEKLVTHRGSLELTNALKGARARPLGDSWAWARKNSTVDISPLVAATLALSSAIDHPEGDLTIY